MKIVTAEDYSDLSRRTAALVCAEVARKPDALLVFPLRLIQPVRSEHLA